MAIHHFRRISGNLVMGGNILFNKNNVYSIGSSVAEPYSVYMRRIMTNYVGNVISVYDDLFPTADNTRDLGDSVSPLEWKNIFIDGKATIDRLVGLEVLSADPALADMDLGEMRFGNVANVGYLYFKISAATIIKVQEDGTFSTITS